MGRRSEARPGEEHGAMSSPRFCFLSGERAKFRKIEVLRRNEGVRLFSVFPLNFSPFPLHLSVVDPLDLAGEDEEERREGAELIDPLDLSSSVRVGLDSPLNYAHNHLADLLLPPCIPRVIYLDSDLLVVDEIRRLWDTRLPARASGTSAKSETLSN